MTTESDIVTAGSCSVISLLKIPVPSLGSVIFLLVQLSRWEPIKSSVMKAY